MRALAAVAMLAACGDNLPGPADGHLFDGKVWGGNIAAADGWVYFTTFGEQDDGEHHAVWRVPRDGGAAEPIWVSSRGIFGKGMALGDGKLYWSEAVDRQLDGNGVFEVSTRGGNDTQLATFATQEAPYAGVSFDGGHVYAGSFDQVLDIANGTQATAYSGGVTWMVHRGGHLYVLNGNTLLADGAVVATLASAGNEFDVDDHAAYVGDGDSLRRIPLDATTTAATILISGAPDEIVVGPHQVYAIVRYADHQELDRIDFATGATHAIASNVSDVAVLAVDDTSVYIAQCACAFEGYVARYAL